MRAAAVLAATTVLAIGFGGAPAHAAPGPSVVPAFYPYSGNADVYPDIDGDGRPELVVGDPAAADGTGAIDVWLSAGYPHHVTRADVPGAGTPAPGDRFGAAVAIIDADRDGHADVVVGAPGENGAGAVHVLFGTPTGFRADQGLTVRGRAGDSFGAEIEADRSPSATATPDVWIGAPYRTVAGHRGAGAVAQWAFTDPGGGPLTLRWLATYTQDSPGVPGAAETGDRFGDVLFASGGNLLVGVPHEDIGAKRDAGMVAALVGGTWSGWTQGTPGVPGGPEGGDRFGAALWGTAVGIPGEDLGSRADAGAVQLFTTPKGTSLEPAHFVTQDSTLYGQPVPGAAEAGDRFGAALAPAGDERRSFLAIGVPGEDVGKHPDAGVVVELNDIPECTSCTHRMLVRHTVAIPGTVTTGEHVGAALAPESYATGQPDPAPSSEIELAIGVPGAVHGRGEVMWEGSSHSSLAGTDGYGLVIAH